jgi:hypothetical protein
MYMNLAAAIEDPVERFRLTMVNSIAYFYPSKCFEKPLNPVLGETYQARGQDGANIYCEQTSHHPPISHYYIEGPDKRYIVHGHASFTVFLWPNSVVITTKGEKTVRFHDGQTITFNNPGDTITNVFMGTMGHQLMCKIEFFDKANGLYGWYEPGNVKRKT